MQFDVNKEDVLAELIASLEAELRKTIGASKDAAEYATDEESRAESKWDTQGLEASYLAAGQAAKARQCAEAIEALHRSRDSLLGAKSEVTMGAVAACEIEGAVEWFFLSPVAGGQVLDVGGREFTVITPESPIAGRIIGRRSGEGFTLANGRPGAVVQVG